MFHTEPHVHRRHAIKLAHDLGRTTEDKATIQHSRPIRKEIDRKYDYRYSQLTQVFGRLLYENRLRQEELCGLREDKLKPIRSFAKFLAEDAA